jgi:hypothetical protein
LGVKRNKQKFGVGLVLWLALCAWLGWAAPSPALALEVPDLPEGYITTVAGGSFGSGGDGGPATAAQLRQPWDVAVDASGNLFIADRDNHRVRMVPARDGTYYGIAMTAGNIYTVAGTGQAGYGGDGGPAVAAKLNTPRSVAVDGAGNLYIADKNNSRVRKVDPGGTITTVAGTGRAGYSGDGGPATAAQLKDPYGLALDGAGNLIICDEGNHRVRVVAAADGTYYGMAMTAGNIYTVAGTGEKGYSGDGGPATAAQLGQPWDVAVDGAGNLYIADRGNHRVRMVPAADGTYYGIAMTAGNIYTVAGTGEKGYSRDGGPATQARIESCYGLAVDGAGNLYLGCTLHIRRVGPDGIITTIAGTGDGNNQGDGGPALKATMDPKGLALDAAGNLYVASSICAVRFIKAPAAIAGLVSLSLSGDPGLVYTGLPLNFDLNQLTLTGTDQNGADFDLSGQNVTWEVVSGPALLSGSTLSIMRGGTLVVRAQVFGVSASHSFEVQWGELVPPDLEVGDINTVVGYGIAGYAGDGGPVIYAQLANPKDVAVDRAGNLLIADSGNHRVRLVAARTGTYYGIPVTAGNIYTVAGNGTKGYAGDGGPAVNAQLNQPETVAVDGAGNLYIGDLGNYRVRKVDATGTITTVVGAGESGYGGDGGPAVQAQVSTIEGLAADSAGNLFLADRDNHRVRMVPARDGTYYGIPMTAGNIYTVAGNGTEGYSGDGGPAIGASLDSPYDVAVDGAGNLVIADHGNHRIRVVAAGNGTYYGVPMTAGNIYTVVGTSVGGSSGDGGPATAARVSYPAEVAVDGAGNLAIAGSLRVRVVVAATGTYAGIPVTAGYIYTVAGTGESGYSGDGGPATEARVGTSGVAFDAAGNLYIAGSHAVRFVKVTEAQETEPVLTTLTLSGSPQLVYSGSPFTFDLNQLTLAGTDQSGAPFDLAGQAVTWTVLSGPATVEGSLLTVTGAGTIEVQASVAGVSSNPLALSVTAGQAPAHAVYLLTPVEDAAYQIGATADGIKTMTVKPGVSGLKYFAVRVTPQTPHEGREAVVFVHTRSGVQASLNATKADFDLVAEAQAGFNVQPGDVVKVYIVDDLTNALDFNPTLLQ